MMKRQSRKSLTCANGECAYDGDHDVHAIEKHPNDDNGDKDVHATKKHPNDEEREAEEQDRGDLSSRCPLKVGPGFAKPPPPSSSPPPHYHQAPSLICKEFFRWHPSCKFVQPGCCGFALPIAQCRLV